MVLLIVESESDSPFFSNYRRQALLSAPSCSSGGRIITGTIQGLSCQVCIAARSPDECAEGGTFQCPEGNVQCSEISRSIL